MSKDRPITGLVPAIRAESLSKSYGETLALDGLDLTVEAKVGSLSLAERHLVEIAKALGMKTMLGCMISSSVSVTAAAHLSPLVDYADLDGNLLIANDPFHGVRVEKGKLMLPSRPGLGLTAAR